jgi:hypothetical protein
VTEIAPGSTASSPGSGPSKRPGKIRKPKRRPGLSNQSRVTNGSELLPGVDGRSPTARRYRDLVNIISADHGGADFLSESRMQLIRRFAAASVLAEQLEARIVAGQQIDLEEHAKLSSTLVRLTNHLGLERVPRDVTPVVGEIIDGHLTITQPAEPAEPESSSSMRNRFAEDVDAA